MTYLSQRSALGRSGAAKTSRIVKVTSMRIAGFGEYAAASYWRWNWHRCQTTTPSAASGPEPRVVVGRVEFHSMQDASDKSLQERTPVGLGLRERREKRSREKHSCGQRVRIRLWEGPGSVPPRTRRAAGPRRWGSSTDKRD